jgi:hypothetical protein
MESANSRPIGIEIRYDSDSFVNQICVEYANAYISDEVFWITSQHSESVI